MKILQRMYLGQGRTGSTSGAYPLLEHKDTQTKKLQHYNSGHDYTIGTLDVLQACDACADMGMTYSVIVQCTDRVVFPSGDSTTSDHTAFFIMNQKQTTTDNISKLQFILGGRMRSLTDLVTCAQTSAAKTFSACSTFLSEDEFALICYRKTTRKQADMSPTFQERETPNLYAHFQFWQLLSMW